MCVPLKWSTASRSLCIRRTHPDGEEEGVRGVSGRRKGAKDGPSSCTLSSLRLTSSQSRGRSSLCCIRGNTQRSRLSQVPRFPGGEAAALGLHTAWTRAATTPCYQVGVGEANTTHRPGDRATELSLPCCPNSHLSYRSKGKGWRDIKIYIFKKYYK